MANENEIIRRKRTVLVVEDNDMNREILCELLADDYEVLEAENGNVGLDQLSAHSGLPEDVRAHPGLHELVYADHA